MALIQCSFFSEVLKLNTSMTVILPQQTQAQIGMIGQADSGTDKHQTLYLLHGYTDDDSVWLRRTSIERYAASLGLAIVMPNVHQSFYTDMKYGNKYWTFLSEELPAIARSFFPLSNKREDNFVAGLSMGGYGAFKWALRCPDQIAAAASLSGAVDMANHITELKDEEMLGLFRLIYGEQSIKGTPEDLLWLIEHSGQMKQKPALYQCCGTEDFLYKDNLSFRDACEQHGYAITYTDGPGDHVWEYWDEKIQEVLAWLPLRKLEQD